MSIGDFASQRPDYDAPPLIEADAATDPVEQFARWIAAATEAGHPQPNAMVLATADETGRPSLRTVLMKDVNEHGAVVWYSNRESQKGRELAVNPRAELLFLWLDLHRQVRVAGTVAVAPDDVSDEYFAGRPRGSQIAAWASPQSTVLADRADLEARIEATTERFGDQQIPRPPHCGCYELTPQSWEFWQGQPNRSHDRLRYRRDGSGWSIDRLAP